MEAKRQKMLFVVKAQKLGCKVNKMVIGSILSTEA
jgi:hypothetical protein